MNETLQDLAACLPGLGLVIILLLFIGWAKLAIWLEKRYQEKR